MMALDATFSGHIGRFKVLPLPPLIGSCMRLEVSCRETPDTRGEHSSDGYHRTAT